MKHYQCKRQDSRWRLILLVLGLTAFVLIAGRPAVGADLSQAPVIELSEAERQWVREHPVIRIAATPDWPPFEERDETGRHVGISADFIRLAASRAGLEVEPHFDSWRALLDKLKKGELDVAPGLNETEDRKQFLAFTDHFIEQFSVIFTTTDRADIEKMEDLAGKKVSVESGYALSEILARDYPAIELVQAKNTLEAIQKLSLKEVDAYVGNQVVGFYLVSKFSIPNVHSVKFFPGKHGMLRFGVRKDWPILRDILNKGLAAITSEERNSIITAYTGGNLDSQTDSISLTRAERDWLEAHPVLRVAAQMQFPPLEFFDVEGRYNGYTAELLQIAAQRLGVRIEAIGLDNARDTAAAVRSKGAEIQGLARRKDPPPAGLLQTQSYLTFPIAILARSGSDEILDLETLKSLRVAVAAGTLEAAYLEEHFPELSIVQTPDIRSGLDRLAFGEFDAFVSLLPAAAHVIQEEGITSLRVAGRLPASFEVVFSVPNDMPELASSLDKVIASLSQEDQKHLLARWISLNVQEGLSFGQVLRWGGLIGAGALVVILVFAAWNRRLSREIEQRKLVERRLHFTQYAVDHAGGAVFWVRPTDGGFSYVNQATCDSLGYDRDELLAMTVFEIDAHFTPERLGQLKATLEDRQTARFESQHRRKDGSLIDVDISVYLAEYDNRELLTASVIDITASKRAQVALRESESRLREILDTGPLGVAILDKDGKRLFVNDTYARMYGEAKEAMIGKQSQGTFADPAVGEGFHTLVDQGAEVYNHEIELRRSDRSTYWAMVTAQPIEYESQAAHLIWIYDITERKQMEQTLEQSREQLQALADNLPEFISMTDHEGRYVFVNKCFEEWVGLGRNDVVGKTVHDLYPQERAAEIFDFDRRAIAARKVMSDEIVDTYPDGKTRTVVRTRFPVILEDGKIIGLGNVNVDITEQKQAEEALQKQKQLIQLLHQTAVSANQARDVEEALKGSIDAICKYLSWPVGHAYRPSPDDPAILQPTDIWHLDDPERFAAFLEATRKTTFKPGVGLPGRVLESGKPVWIVDVTKDSNFPRARLAVEIGVKAGFGVPVLVGDKVAVVMEFFAAEAIEPNQDLLAVLENVGTQIGRVIERKQAEGALQTAHKRLDLATKAAGVGIFDLDIESSRFYWDASLRNIYGVDDNLSEHDFDDWVSYIHPDDRSLARSDLDRAIAGEAVFSSVYRIKRPDGETRYIESDWNVIRDHDDRPTKIIGSNYDVTNLKVAAMQAEAANQAKSLFLASMTHEIRTPMNAILGYAQIMQRDTSLRREHVKILDTINRSGNHLLGLINDILDMSKIEAGRMELVNVDFDLHSLLDDIYIMLRIRAEGKGLKFVFSRAVSVPQYIHGDQIKIRQILINLLGNSIKFTEQGQIELDVGVISKTRDKIGLQMTVKDTGIGIKPDMLNHVFTTFAQTIDGQRVGGTGLGLTISKQMAMLMSGDIKVQSEYNRGSSFTVTLKLGRSSAEAISSKPVIGKVTGIKKNQKLPLVLIVDDNETNRNLFREMLEPLGFPFLEAEDGSRAVEQFRGHRPGVVLMDIVMPVMDGIEATTEIRRMAEGKNTVIIAVTASAMETQIQQAKHAGIDKILHKPVDFDELLLTIGDLAKVKLVIEDHEQEPAVLMPQVTAEMLEAVPDELISIIKSALQSGNIAELRKHTAPLAEIEVDLGVAYEEMVDHFMFNELNELFSTENK
jgi:PAS domain S-box-containing protein